MTGWINNGDGTSTFQTSYGPITIPNDRLNNSFLGDDISDITTSTHRYHEYFVETTLGYSTDDVSLQVVQNALAEYPTPFGSYFAGPGFVSHYSPDANTVINITRQLHLLEPGVVVRKVVIEEGQYKIITYGMGTGFLARRNEEWARTVWGLADAFILHHIIIDTFENGNLILPEPGGFRTTAPEDQCFGASTPIDMWPLDPTVKAGSVGIYDEEVVRAQIWRKPIEQIRADDIVVSFDRRGNLVPRRVTRTFVNDVAHVLDFHGTGVTPGHVFLCGAGRFKGRHVPLIDILRDDGAVVRQDGSLMRASTGCAVGSDGDRVIEVVAADGSTGWVRAGMRVAGKTGEVAVSALIVQAGEVICAAARRQRAPQ
ncbi:MAG: hypothetical protein IOD01_14565 [Rhodobacter sp.]|nr:hypothetical protein [Rhodobacter sp.]